MSKKKQVISPWREITWTDYVLWLQGKTVAPNPHGDFVDDGEALLDFSDGSQVKIAYGREWTCGNGTCFYRDPPMVWVREKHE